MFGVLYSYFHIHTVLTTSLVLFQVCVCLRLKVRWRSRFGAFHTRDPVLRYTHHLHFKYISNHKYVICLGIKEYSVRFRKNNQVYLNLPHVLKCCGSLISLQKGMHTKYRTKKYISNWNAILPKSWWLTHTHTNRTICVHEHEKNTFFFSRLFHKLL